MHTTTNGQNGQRRLDHYTEDTTPTTPAPPPFHSSYPPVERSIGFYEVYKVLLKLAAVLAAVLYIASIILAFVFFSDNWYKDEAARTMQLEGLAILFVGIGLGASGHKLWSRRH